MKQSNTSKFAYLAGLIDGEGTIGIYSKNDRQDRGLSSFRLIVSVSQKRGGIMDWLFGNFGGKILTKIQKTTTPDKRKEYENSMYEWRIDNLDRIEYILKRTAPFMLEKKKQAEIALQFIAKHNHVSKSGKRFGFVIRYPEHIIEDWKTFALNKSKELKLEKRIFVPCAAVETKLSKSSKDGKL